MAKAALNMLTHTAAGESGIFMNTGWVTDEDPELAKMKQNFQPLVSWTDS
jgi:hypothetical protein